MVINYCLSLPLKQEPLSPDAAFEAATDAQVKALEAAGKVVLKIMHNAVYEQKAGNDEKMEERLSDRIKGIEVWVGLIERRAEDARPHWTD